MKVLQVFNEYLEKGGEEKSVNRIYETLSKDLNIQQCRFSSASWTGQDKPNVISQAVRMFYNPGSIRQIREMHRKQLADTWLLHNIFPVGSAGIYREAKRLNVPLVYYIHNFRPFSVNGYLWAGEHLETAGLRKNFWPEVRSGSWQDSHLKTAWYALILKYLHATHAFRQIRGWISISDFMREKFIEAGVPGEDIYVLPHSWEPLPSVPDHRDEGHYLFLGRLVKMKGLHTLFQAWDILEDRLGDQTPRLIIGGDGPMRAEVEDFAERHPRIECVGQVNGQRKHELLQGCRSMIAPSLCWESLGLVTYEAYDYGKPMLAAASGGLTETVQNGITGFLHPPGDAETLVRQIMEIDSDSERRRSMGLAGRTWLLENTSKETWKKRFLEIIKEVTEKSKS